MAQIGDHTPFFKRRRNAVTVMVFLLMFIFPSLKDSQPFQTSVFPLEIINLFALANLLSQLFGGVIAMKFGGHQVENVIKINYLITFSFQVIFWAVISSSSLNMSIPILTAMFRDSNYFPRLLVIASGLFQGPVMPSLLVMWSKWLPPVERAKTIGVAFCGAYFGFIFHYHVQKYQINHMNAQHIVWDYYFNYILGCLGLGWAILWRYLVRNSPEMVPHMTLEEKTFIRNALAGQSTHKNVAIPWKSILTSIAVLAIIVATFVQNWAYFSLLIDVPNYSTYPQISYVTVAVATLASGFVLDFLRNKFEKLTFGKARRFVRHFVCSSLILQIVCIILVLGLSQVNVVQTFKLIGLVFASFVSVCITVSYLEIAPQFAGVLFGICSFVAGLLGALRPLTIIILKTNLGVAIPNIMYAIVLCKFFLK